MSNETKREVFDKLLNEYVDDEGLIDGIVNEPDKHIAEIDREYFINSYDAALPDYLPVIPEAVGDVIVKLKHKKFSLSGAMSYAAVVSLSPWMTFEHDDTFALAWVLGVWRVEETGEILKLDAEK